MSLYTIWIVGLCEGSGGSVTKADPELGVEQGQTGDG